MQLPSDAEQMPASLTFFARMLLSLVCYPDLPVFEPDALLARSNVDMDLQKRAEIFAEAEKLMLADYPITPMWFQVTKNLVDPTLTGWSENAVDQHRSRFLCRDGMKAQ